MANNTQTTIYREFILVAGAQPAEADASQQSTAGALSSLGEVMRAAAANAAPAAAASLASSSGSQKSTASTVISEVLKSGLGLIPLVASLFGLFGGSGTDDAAPLVKFALPSALRFEGARTANGIENVDYDQMGRPRAYGAESTAGANTAPPAQITVNVQAMDARSFLDRSTDIAAAVREAMLQLHSINDVVNDL